MNRTLLIVALLGSTAAAASVHAKTMPPIAPDPKGTVAPFNGTAEQAMAEDAIRNAGFTAVNSLWRASDGTWHGRAQKNNADVAVAVDRNGRASAQ